LVSGNKDAVHSVLDYTEEYADNPSFPLYSILPEVFLLSGTFLAIIGDPESNV
jgi:hypothetical protein